MKVHARHAQENGVEVPSGRPPRARGGDGAFRPFHSEALEAAFGGDLDRLALDDDVEPSIPLVAAGREDDIWVAAQIAGLLLGGAGREVNGVVEPHGDKRGDARSTICADGRAPEQLRHSSTRRVSSHTVATASGSLNLRSSFVSGPTIARSLSIVRRLEARML
jgi:hypothetical protein